MISVLPSPKLHGSVSDIIFQNRRHPRFLFFLLFSFFASRQHRFHLPATRQRRLRSSLRAFGQEASHVVGEPASDRRMVPVVLLHLRYSIICVRGRHGSWSRVQGSAYSDIRRGDLRAQVARNSHRLCWLEI